MRGDVSGETFLNDFQMYAITPIAMKTVEIQAHTYRVV